MKISLHELNQKLEEFQRRHNALAKKFADFGVEAEALFKPGISCVNGIALSYEANQQQINVTFLDRTVRFVFKTKPAESGVLIGYVEFVLLEGRYTSQESLIGSFTFNGSGIVDGFVSSDGDPMSMTEDTDVIHLVLLCLFEAVSLK